MGASRAAGELGLTVPRMVVADLIADFGVR
jgi:hypothetical protein